MLGNLAASIVVRQFGTATTDVIQIKAVLQVLIQDKIHADLDQASTH